jgi:PAS domain S-box-containing protein
MLWQAIVHLASLGIGSYGVYLGTRLMKLKRKTGIIFTAAVGIFLVVLAEEVLAIHLGISIIPRLGNMFLPLDLYPILFILIMVPVFVSDLAMKYKLQIDISRREVKWSTLMNNVKLLVTELDLQGNIQYVNAHFEKLTGYRKEEVFNKNWFELLIPSGEKDRLVGLFNDLKTEKTAPDSQNRIISKAGKEILLNWSNLPIVDAVNTITGVLSIGFDLTQQEERISEIKQLKKQLEKENLILQDEIKRRSGGLSIIGESNSIKYTINKALQVAPLDSTVLLEGETGVGKEVFADLIQSKSSRQHFPYLKINCAAIPRELIESELFGHKKGSFTGAVSDKKGMFSLADKGTLFLDEISTMPLELQSKLLRVLQSGTFHPVGSETEKKVNVRIIAATNENLIEKSDQNQFRKDLFYRLNVYPITIPPLRQRKEDIPLLISHFSRIIGDRLNKPMGSISKADLESLEAYDWPGNVRELENWVERAIITSSNGKLKFSPDQISSNGDQSYALSGNEHSMDEIQAEIIRKTLEDCNWKINGEDGAARRLKLPPSTLRSRMKKLGIERPAY